MADPFVDRLREAVIDPATLDVDAIRAAVSSAAKRFRAPAGLDLVRIAYGQWEMLPDEAESIRATLNSQTAVVEDEGQHQLLSVLAAECLIETYARSASIPVLTGLAVRCAERMGWTPVHVDLPAFAERFLLAQAHSARQLPASPPQVASPRGELPAGDSGALLERLAKQVDSLRSTVNALVGAQGRHQRVDSEQREIMWWLSRAPEPDASPLQVALDLASITRVLPGPVATDELLAARLRRNLSASTADPQLADTSSRLVPAIPDQLRDFCPALSASAPNGDGPARQILARARRFYDELILIRAYNAITAK
jgi:hypothetical protein